MWMLTRMTGVCQNLYEIRKTNFFWSYQGAFESAPTPTPQRSQMASSSSNPPWDINVNGPTQLRGVPGAMNGKRLSPLVERAKSPAIQRPQSPLPRPSSQALRPKSPPQDTTWDAIDTWDSANGKLSPTSSSDPPVSQPLSKEDKALEMARRKEERKQVRKSEQKMIASLIKWIQRIAMLKEQKKTVAKPVWD